MAFYLVCIFLLIFPIGFLPLAADISNRFVQGAGAAIPGVLLGIAVGIVCWSMLLGMVVNKIFFM